MEIKKHDLEGKYGIAAGAESHKQSDDLDAKTLLKVGFIGVATGIISEGAIQVIGKLYSGEEVNMDIPIKIGQAGIAGALSGMAGATLEEKMLDEKGKEINALNKEVEKLNREVKELKQKIAGLESRKS